MFDSLSPGGDSLRLSRRTALSIVAAGAAAASTSPLWGQAKGAKKGEEAAPPETVSMETKDGVLLRATYYKGSRGKKAVPVLMVHGWGGQRDEYRPIATNLLQKAGHAVLAVDLRGHGESTRQKMRDGEIKEVDREKMRAADIRNMGYDLEACKKFLVEKNNAEELNATALCVVAAEFGCIIALQWSVLDWSVRNLAAYRQGHDVQAIVMLSPMESFKGVPARDAITSNLIKGNNVSKLIAVGTGDSKSFAEARRIHTKYEGFHGKQPEDETRQDLFFLTADTKLQGTKLLDMRAFEIWRGFGLFLAHRLEARMDEFPWEERKPPV